MYHDAVQQEWKDLLASGIIEPSDSPWSALIVLVKKKDKYLRPCVTTGA